MWNRAALHKPRQLNSWRKEMDTMAEHVKEKATEGRINILEAGCGITWSLDLDDVKYTLTGVDLDKDALDIRRNQKKDLDVAVLGDLRNVYFAESSFDVVYNSFVLEHIDGAEAVLENFVRWLKPGGILVIRIPNRDSVRGFMTRMTPFFFHVLYEKYVAGHKNAGKPGHPPFPTFFDKCVSNAGINGFCKKHGLIVKAKYGGGIGQPYRNKLISSLENLIYWTLHLLSLGGLSVRPTTLIFVLEKPQSG